MNEKNSITKVCIGVDHGNRQIKTKNCTFVSGLTVSDLMPPATKDVLFYNNKYYTLSHKRIPYARNKTENDDFFILTLFAIAEELIARKFPDGYFDISLGVGLPLSHYSSLKDTFKRYFLNRGRLYFKYKGREFYVCVEHVHVYPQGYAAMIHQFEKVVNVSKMYIVDIGGYTTDILLLRRGSPDMQACTSLEMGVIKYYRSVIDKVYTQFDITLDEDHINEILANPNADYPPEIISMVYEEAQKYSENLVNQLRELGYDLRIDKSYFAGGGSLLFKPFLVSTNKVTKATFADNINDNALGYEWAVEKIAQTQ